MRTLGMGLLATWVGACAPPPPVTSPPAPPVRGEPTTTRELVAGEGHRLATLGEGGLHVGWPREQEGRVAATPRGDRIVVQIGRGLEVIDVASGARLAERRWPRGMPTGMAVDHARVAVVTDATQVFALHDLSPLRRIDSRSLEGLVALGPGPQLVVGGWEIERWDLDSGRRTASYDNPVVDVQGLLSTEAAIVLGGGAFATVGGEGEPTVNDLGHPCAPRALSPDGTKILCTSDEPPSAQVLDVEGGTIARRDGRGIGFTAEGSVWLVHEGRVVRWDPARDTLDDTPLALPDIAGAIGVGHRHLASWSPYGTVALWDIDGGEQLHPPAGHREAVEGLAFGPDGTHLWSCAEDGTLRRWDLATRRDAVIADGLGACRALALAPDGAELALATSAGVYTFTLEGKPTARPRDFGAGDASDVAYDRRRRLVIATSRGDLLIRDGSEVETRAGGAAGAPEIPMATLLAGLDVVDDVGEVDEVWRLLVEATQPASQYGAPRPVALTVGADRTLVFGARRPQLLRAEDLGVPPDPIPMLAPWPDPVGAVQRVGDLLVTGFDDGTLLAQREGEAPHRRLRHRHGIASLAVSPDGTVLASGGRDGTIALFDAAPLSQSSAQPPALPEVESP